MRRVNTVLVDNRKALVERVAASRYISKSARLRDLLVYVCDRVIDESVETIHEQEVGQHVFGRAPDYDTTIDNIVRVHASTLRKRLEQYFASDGASEPLILELPKGNYAPQFRERPVVAEAEPAAAPTVVVEAPRSRTPWNIVAWGLALVFAASTVFLLLTRSASHDVPKNVRAFWSQVFRKGQSADIVLDDASVGLYGEMTSRPITLSEYFDRSYQRRADAPAGADKLLLKRYSSFAGANLLWRIGGTAHLLETRGAVHFARDYSFSQLKSDCAVLLGNSLSNPWIEPFENRVGIRWKYDEVSTTYLPVDTWAKGVDRERFKAGGDGYGMVALLPNLGGTGNVLIISGSGGAAMSSMEDFLTDEASVGQLLGKLPYFEALVRIKSRSRQVRDMAVVLARAAK